MSKLTISERKCLAILVSQDEPDFCVLSFNYIANHARLNLAQTRRAVRRLARKGLAKYSVAFDCDDGKMAGGGYMAIRSALAQSTEKP